MLAILPDLSLDLARRLSHDLLFRTFDPKLKQRELSLNQRHEELQRKNSEVEAVKENLASQLELVEKKKQDLERMHQKEVEHLETISGLSANEAKERLIESLKDEAKTQAASYINEAVIAADGRNAGDTPVILQLHAEAEAFELLRVIEDKALSFKVVPYAGDECVCCYL